VRWVWVVIPLVLIGIVEVQEGFSLCVKTPCLDQPTGLWSEYISQEPFELQKGLKEASFGAIPIHFRLLDVEDSRCPSDVQCVWEGLVIVTVGVTVNWVDLGNYSISLNEPLDGSIIQLDQYYLQLIKVEPYPTSTELIPEWDYVATMKFSKIEILSPLKQVNNGVSLESITCKNELKLIFKPSDNSPACVKPQTAEKLIQRGWAIDEIIPQSMSIEQTTENSLISIQTDKTEYNYNEVIHIKGQVADTVSDPCNKFLVSVHVRNNDNTKFYDYASPEVNSDCIYETTIDISGSKWIHEGIYILTASPGNGAITASTEIELISGFTPHQRPFDSKDIVLDLSSPTEFVDDGREYPRAMGHRGPPQLMYDIIIDSYKDFDVNEKGVTTFTTIPHEKYSINPGVGFYAEDWFPEYIPDGQKLLFTETSCYESGSCGLGITFVPTTFVLTPFTTNHNLNLAKGFSIGVNHSTLSVDELEDSAEHLRESFIESEGGYGEIREMTRDGNAVLAFAGGNSVNPYQASVSFHPDKFTSVSVHSNYHTLDELIPIFESIMNE